MPSSWNVYYVIFLSAVLALGIPASLALISSVVSPRARRGFWSWKSGATRVLDESIRTNESVLGKKINARFFLGMNSALVLITFMLALIPCAGMIHAGSSKTGLLRAVVALVTVTAFAALGLLYSIRKGDLSWLRTYQKQDDGAVEELTG